MLQKNLLLDALNGAQRAVRNRQVIFALTGLTTMKLVSKWFTEFDELKTAGTDLTRDQYVHQEQQKLFTQMKDYEANHKTNNDKAAVEELHQRTD